MSLGRSTPTTMDLAAIRIGEVKEVRPGVFRHGESLVARLARLFSPPAPPVAPQQPPRRRRAAAKTQGSSK